MTADTGAPIRNGERGASLWRNRNWLLLWGGQLVSVAGTEIAQIAYPLLMLTLTNSPAQAGFLTAARTVPFLILGLPAGALVDRWNRKKVMLVCDAGRALALGSIPLALMLERLTFAQLYLVALIEGSLNVFFTLAESATLSRIVTREELATASSLNEISLAIGSTLGPALGGLVFAIGQGFAFLADALSFIVSVVSIWFIRVPLTEAREEQRKTGARALWEDIHEGMVWLWRQRLLRLLTIIVGAMVMIESGYLLIVLILAQRMSNSSAVVGLVLGAGGVGSIVGAALSGPIGRRYSLGRIAQGVFWIWALLLPLYALAPNPAALAAITFGTYGVTPIFFATQYGYRLAVTPGPLQARVSSAYRLLLFLGQPLGLTLAGLLSQSLGPIHAILIFAALLLAIALLVTLNRDLRHTSKITEAQIQL